jgi:hypothetical protein
VWDLVDFLRYDIAAAGEGTNPLVSDDGRPAIERAYAWKRSQSGRYLREFVYRGWNEGRDGKPVFDAVWPHVTGGGHFAMNLRFGHPDRYPRQHENTYIPRIIFSFSYVQDTYPWSGQSDALLRHLETNFFVIHTQPRQNTGNVGAH